MATGTLQVDSTTGLVSWAFSGGNSNVLYASLAAAPSLAAADTAAAGAGVALIIDTSASISASLSLSAPLIIVLAGSVLTVAASQTLTVGGSIVAADNQQCFNVAASGSAVALTTQKRVSAQWFSSTWGQGSVDDTPAITAAVAAAGSINGATVVLPLPASKILCNYVYSGAGGIIFQGPGVTKSAGSSTSVTGYLTPTNTALPVFTIGNDSGVINGLVLRDLSFLGISTGTTGLQFGGGCYRIKCFNVESNGFTQNQILFNGGTTNPISEVEFHHVLADAGTAGGNGIKLVQTHSAAYITDIKFIGGDVSATVGAFPVVVDGCYAHFSGVYLQGAANQPCVLSLNSNSQASQGYITVDAGTHLDVLSDTAYNALAIGAHDLQSLTTPPSIVQGPASAAAKIAFFSITTTGSGITSGQATFTPASLTGFFAGRTVYIPGAGSGGGTYIDIIKSINGGTGVVTLNSNILTTITGSTTPVYVGDTSYLTATGNAGLTGLSIQNLSLSGDTSIPVLTQAAALMHRPGGNSAAYPFGQYHHLWELQQSELHILQQTNNTLSPVSVSMSGSGLVTVNVASHPLRTGDWILANGANEEGFNGPYPVTVTGAGTFTYQAVYPPGSQLTYSPGGSGVIPTGTIIYYCYRDAFFKQGYLHAQGLYMKDESGNDTLVLSQSPTNGNFFVQTPDTAGGQFIFQCGSSASTANGLTVYNGTTSFLQIDRNGNVYLGLGILATSATNGFAYMPTCAGAPTGTPTAKSGFVPFVYDTTDNKLYVHNGTWKAATLS